MNKKTIKDIDLNKELKMYKKAGECRTQMDMLLKDKKVNNM